MLYYSFHKVDIFLFSFGSGRVILTFSASAKFPFKIRPRFCSPCTGFLRWSLLLSCIVAFYAQSPRKPLQSWHMALLLLRISALSLLPILSMLRLQTEPEYIVHMGRCQTFHRIRRAVIDLDLAVFLQNHPSRKNHMIAESPANLIVCLRYQQGLPAHADHLAGSSRSSSIIPAV